MGHVSHFAGRPVLELGARCRCGSVRHAARAETATRSAGLPRVRRRAREPSAEQPADRAREDVRVHAVRLVDGRPQRPGKRHGRPTASERRRRQRFAGRCRVRSPRSCRSASPNSAAESGRAPSRRDPQFSRRAQAIGACSMRSPGSDTRADRGASARTPAPSPARLQSRCERGNAYARSCGAPRAVRASARFRCMTPIGCHGLARATRRARTATDFGSAPSPIEWSPERRRDWMLDRLRHVVRRAAADTPYYAEFFAASDSTLPRRSTSPISLRSRCWSAARFAKRVKRFARDPFRPPCSAATQPAARAARRPRSGSVPRNAAGERAASNISCGESGCGEAAGRRLLWVHHLDPLARDGLRERVLDSIENARWYDCVRLSPELLDRYHAADERRAAALHRRLRRSRRPARRARRDQSPTHPAIRLDASSPAPKSCTRTSAR